MFRFARAIPAGAAALLEGTGIAVDVRGNVGYSLAEIDSVAAKVHDTLLASGFKSIASGPDIKTNTIQVELQASPVQAIATQAAILSSVVLPAGVKLKISPTSGTAIVPTHTRGGAWMTLSNNNNWCTSAFTVEHISTREQGVTTASHCEGLTRYRQPSDGAVYGAPWRGESLQPSGGGNFASPWGDVEWHATTHDEYAEFYSDATTTRRQQALRPAGNIMVGNDACFYGRASNARNCNEDVHALNQRITFPYNGGTATVDRQIFMTGRAGTIGGDSGGGWSWNFEALGIQHGFTNGTPQRAVWSIADHLDEALGVRVIVQP